MMDAEQQEQFAAMQQQMQFQQQQMQFQQQQAQRPPPPQNCHTHVVIYPQYIDATLTPSLGRRTTLQHAVAHPTLDEMFNAAKALGFTDVFADPTKSLPRAQSQPFCIPPLRGVIKVNMDSKKGGPDVPNKSALLRAVADHIAAIPDRKVADQTHAQRYATAAAEAGASAMAHGADKKVKKEKRRIIRR